jgi:plastocyanin
MTSITFRRSAVVLVASAVAGAAVIPTVAGATGASAAATKTVHIVDIAYKPRKLTVRKGTTVKWSFDDQIVAHTVTSTGAKKFKSSPEKMNGTYKVTFRKAGTYKYFCMVHPNISAMKGTIVVK